VGFLVKEGCDSRGILLGRELQTSKLIARSKVLKAVTVNIIIFPDVAPSLFFFRYVPRVSHSSVLKTETAGSPRRWYLI
jgi:hypothetical protein